MTDTSLKVVQYAPSWLPQTQTWLYSQVRNLPPGVESHVVCRSTRNLAQFEVPNIHSLKQEGLGPYLLYKLRYAFGSRDGFPYLTEQLRSIRPAVVHSHFGNNGWTVREAVRRAGCRHVVTFYGQDMSKLPKSKPVWRQRYPQLFAEPDTLFLCEGSAMGRSLEQLGCPPEKIRVQHLGVDVSAVPYRPRRWTPGEPLKVLIAASFREKKGIPYAIEALGRIQRELPLQVTIIGDAEPTEAGKQEKHKILDAIRRHGLEPATRLLGYQPFAVLRAEFEANHLFLAPSVTAADGDSEGGAPVSLTDAAASGIAVVSSFHCDIPEVIRHGQTGWLAQERDVDGITEAVRRWLSADAAQWHAWLDAGRRHIEQEYDAAVQGQRLAAIYRGTP